MDCRKKFINSLQMNDIESLKKYQSLICIITFTLVVIEITYKVKLV